jgi:hypothetical protein
MDTRSQSNNMKESNKNPVMFRNSIDMRNTKTRLTEKSANEKSKEIFDFVCKINGKIFLKFCR